MQTDIDRRRRQRLHDINDNDRLFRETGNPVYAWDAIAESLAIDSPLPPYSRDYLFSAAAAITRLSRGRQPHKGQIARAILDALQFSRVGRRNPFREMCSVIHENLIAMDVYHCYATNRSNYRRRLEPQHDWRTVYRDAAARHHERCDHCKRPPSWQTVERYWRKHALQEWRS